MEQEPGFTYAASGVDYGPLDHFKRVCQRAAQATASCLEAHGLSEPAGIRGESAYLVETADGFLAHVEEGLGTKNLVADALFPLAHPGAYRNIGIDTVAAIVNDLIVVGALPVAVAMHAAVGESGWFSRDSRGEELAAGFAHGCRLAGAAWGGGESPVLKGVVEPGGIVLAGSALGRVSPKRNRILGNVQDGDAVVLLASSGIHANGVTLCRAIAARLPEGYRTTLGDGRGFGTALLEPAVVYVPFIRSCQEEGIVPHYAVHITGHGWRKLMRLQEPFVYRVTEPPAPSALYQFLLREGKLSPREAYATWNMGAGFAVYVEPRQAERCVAVARDVGLPAWVAGTVAKQGERKAVEIVPLGICFEGQTLEVRA